MFSLKLIFAAFVATQFTWASNLLWFEQEEQAGNNEDRRELQRGPRPPRPRPPRPDPPAPGPSPPPPPAP